MPTRYFPQQTLCCRNKTACPLVTSRNKHSVAETRPHAHSLLPATSVLLQKQHTLALAPTKMHPARPRRQATPKSACRQRALAKLKFPQHYGYPCAKNSKTLQHT